MRIKHRYSFNTRRKEIIDFLDSKNIKYKKEPILTSFEIFEDDINWVETKNIMFSNNLTSLVENKYTKKEITSAEWLRIRGKWRWEYPQPEDEYRSITYSDTNYCHRCGRGLIQKNSFYIKKEPNWEAKKFLQLFWIEDELFVENEIADKLLQTNLQGFSFLSVRHHKTNDELKTIKQLKIKNIFNEKLVFNKDEINKKIICSKCNKVKYVLFGNAIIKANKKHLDNYHLDILKTEDVFGDGVVAARYILISNKFAKLIIDNNWKDIVLEPIQLL